MIFLSINKKKYFCKINNFFIIDYLNINIGKNIIFKDINLLFLKKIYYNNLFIKINCIVIKHFYIKKISYKKKRRKNFKKKNICYIKKTLLFVQKIF